MKKLNVVFVMAIHHASEFDYFQRVLDSWDRLVDTPFQFSILFSTSLGKVPKTAFPQVVLDWTDDPACSSQTNVSLEWAKIARTIHERVECDCWFWWESDVFPVRRDCFSFLLERWREETKIMGYLVRDRKYGMKDRVNGVAFYSRDFCKQVELGRIARGTNFDQLRAYTAADLESGLLVPFNAWCCLKHHELRTRLSRETRLVHGEKDPRFLDRILSGRLQAELIPERARWLAVEGTVAWFALRHRVKQALIRLKLMQPR